MQKFKVYIQNIFVCKGEIRTTKDKALKAELPFEVIIKNRIVYRSVLLNDAIQYVNNMNCTIQ